MFKVCSHHVGNKQATSYLFSIFQWIHYVHHQGSCAQQVSQNETLIEFNFLHDICLYLSNTSLILSQDVIYSILFIFRKKAYNTAQLIMYMAEVFNLYMRNRLVEVALSRRAPCQRKAFKFRIGTVSPHIVTPLGENKYRVPSQAEGSKVKYLVDLNVGTCSCVSGK